MGFGVWGLRFASRFLVLARCVMLYGGVGSALGSSLDAFAYGLERQRVNPQHLCSSGRYASGFVRSN